MEQPRTHAHPQPQPHPHLLLLHARRQPCALPGFLMYTLSCPCAARKGRKASPYLSTSCTHNPDTQEDTMRQRQTSAMGVSTPGALTRTHTHNEEADNRRETRAHAHTHKGDHICQNTLGERKRDGVANLQAHDVRVQLLHLRLLWGQGGGGPVLACSACVMVTVTAPVTPIAAST